MASVYFDNLILLFGSIYKFYYFISLVLVKTNRILETQRLTFNVKKLRDTIAPDLTFSIEGI